MLRRSLTATTVLFSVAVTLIAQDALPGFEVASIKRRDQPASGFPGPPVLGGALNIPSTTLAGLIRFGHGVRDFQVVGGPDWVRRDLFEVEARAAGEPSPDAIRSMLRALLADRFGLVTHSERRDMPLFALVMSDGDNRPGPFLHQTPVGGPCDYDELQSKEKNRPRPSSGYAMFTMYCAPMSNFVLLVTNQVDRPVVDRTGLTGDWSGFLYFAPDPGRSPLAGRADPNLAALPTALEEQFGLKLEPTHGPVDVIVIDSVHAPTSN